MSKKAQLSDFQEKHTMTTIELNKLRFRLKKMLGTSISRGGNFKKSFFSILAKNIQNQKKFSKQKKFVF